MRAGIVGAYLVLVVAVAALFVVAIVAGVLLRPLLDALALAAGGAP